MDCAKLKADIERLREARDAFNAAIAKTEANDTGLGKIKFNEAMKRASELEDEILRSYMEDVGEHNPELFRGFRYGEKIDGFHRDISSTVKLSDNEVLVCGGIDKKGEMRILRKGEDDLWSYDGNSIGGFDNAIYSTLKLSDDEVLVCGDGETRILRKSEDGLWGYIDDNIDGFNDEIFSTMKLSDNEVLVCGGDGSTRILRIDGDIDIDKLKQKLPDIAAKKDEA